MMINDVALVGAEVEAALHSGSLESLAAAYRYAAARAELAWVGEEDGPESVRPTMLPCTARPTGR